MKVGHSGVEKNKVVMIQFRCLNLPNISLGKTNIESIDGAERRFKWANQHSRELCLILDTITSLSNRGKLCVSVSSSLYSSEKYYTR